MSANPSETPQTALAASPVERPSDPRIRLAQLAQLHDEAQETAMLANLLGRAPHVMASLAACAALTTALIFRTAPLEQTAVWLLLVGAGIAAIWRIYGRAMAAPFELAGLRNFAADLCAVLFYAGFAWGAGAFLILPQSWGTAAVAAFAAGPCALVSGFLQSRLQMQYFVAPAALLTALAVLLRPLGGGLAEAGLVVAACAAIGVLSVWMESVFRPESAPHPAGLALR